MNIEINQIGMFSLENNDRMRIMNERKYLRVSKVYRKTGIKQADITARLTSHEKVV
jgi:hypothetical protein